MPAALVATGVQKAYGGATALVGADLTVEAGELVGLLGPNGAGKSTLMKIACGLVRPTGGEMQVLGSPPGSLEARQGIGYLAELFRFPDWLTADEVLTLHQRLAGSSGGAAERGDLLNDVELAAAATKRVASMSKGMQQRLGIAQALIGSPRLVMLDEPTSALDPVGRRLVRDLLARLRDSGVTVLLNSHLLSEIELVCDRVAIMLGGRIVQEGAPAELARPRGLEVETQSGTRVIEGAGRDEAPAIVAELVASGDSVYSVRALSSSLEDAYLEAVGSA